MAEEVDVLRALSWKTLHLYWAAVAEQVDLSSARAWQSLHLPWANADALHWGRAP